MTSSKAASRVTLHRRLTNAEVKLLPPNCMPLVQPLRQGTADSVPEQAFPGPSFQVDIFRRWKCAQPAGRARRGKRARTISTKLDLRTGSQNSQRWYRPKMADDQALHNARRNLQGDGAAPGDIELDDFLCAYSAGIASKKLRRAMLLGICETVTTATSWTSQTPAMTP